MGQKQKRDEFRSFREAMSRKGDYIEGDTPEAATATSTSGVQGLKAFQERWGLQEEAERRGEIDRGTSLVLGRLGVASDIGARNVNSAYGVPAMYSPFWQGSNVALDPYQRRAGMQLQSNMYNAQMRDSMYDRFFDIGGLKGIFESYGFEIEEIRIVS